MSCIPLPRTCIAIALGTLFSFSSGAAVVAPPPIATVVVTAAGFEQASREAPASVTVLTREKLSQERFANLTQALESLEGIDVGAAADKTGGMQIAIRGMPSDYTLIMIDGRRQNAAGTSLPTVSPAPRTASCLHWARSNASRSSAAPCPRCMGRTPWAAW